MLSVVENRNGARRKGRREMNVEFKFAIDDVVINQFGEVGIVKGLFLNVSDKTVSVRHKGKDNAAWEVETDLRLATEEETTSMGV